MYIKEFLKESEIQQLLEQENLDEIYRKVGDKPYLLTEFFLQNNIEPLKYMSYVPKYMYSEVQVENIVIPDTITVIEMEAFSCRNLKNITIPASVTAIGEAAFRGCEKLTGVNITDIAAWCEIEFSRNYANPLYYAKNLYLNGKLVTDLVISDGVTSIRDSAFEYCESIKSVEIPGSVKYICRDTFRNCTNLKLIYYKSTKFNWYKVRKFEDWSYKSGLQEIICTDGVIKI